MATVIDVLFMELGIDTSKFSPAAQEAIQKIDEMTDSIEKTESKTKKVNKGLDQHSTKIKQNTKQAKNFGEAIGKITKGFAAFGELVMGSNTFNKLVQEAAQASTQLDNLSHNIGMARNQLQSWGGITTMTGGNADAMKNSLAGLSMSITRLTTMGDTSIVPFFNAFGVALLNSDGKARNLDNIMLDLSDRFSKMDRVQAYNLAKSMGMDDDTINTLLMGRTEMERMLALQERLYHSGEQEIKINRELVQARGYLNTQWDAMKQMLADALAPILLKVAKIVSSFVDYLMQHEHQIKHVFEGLAYVIGALLVPMFITALAGLLAFIAPFAPLILTIGALGGAFIALLDDYKTWAEGGKSLFDWKWLQTMIDNNSLSVSNLSSGFLHLLTGYTSWSEAANGLLDWLKLKGFIDQNGVSIESLANGFHNLYLEIKNYLMPYFNALGDAFTKLMQGDFQGAWDVFGKLDSYKQEAQQQQIQPPIANEANNRGMVRQARAIAGAEAGETNKGTNKGTRKNHPYKGTGFTQEKGEIIKQVAHNIGVNPNDLAAVISFESSGSFSPNARNPKSSATGLIQFMAGSGGTKGQYYGMTRDQFGSLSFGEQMKYVERYFKERGFRADKKQDVANLYTAVTGYGYRKGTPAYDLNSMWDVNHNNVIDKGEMVLGKKFRAHQKNYFPEQVEANVKRGMESIRQGDAIRQRAIRQNNTNNHQKNMQVSINGGINVQSSASTIDGTMADAAAAARDRLIQLVPSMV